MPTLRTAPKRTHTLEPLNIAKQLVARVNRLRFGPPVTCVYNPLEYAQPAYAEYLRRYGSAPRDVLMVGMNPGPWGMAQTGIPFGEVNAVRDWLGIRAKVSPPRRQHPSRPVLGMDCTRSEVSGQRVWGWAKDKFGTPDAFFKRFLIINYCPLCFMEESGLNRTPDKLAAEERDPLLAACDAALQEMVAYYKPHHVIAIGGFVERRARIALQGVDAKIGRILHPSPASPIANRGWAVQVEKQLEALGI